MSETNRPVANEQPRVWLLADDRPGNTTQSVGLAQALGWPYEVKQLCFTPLAELRNRWLRTYGATLAGLDRARSSELAPPWPDLVIAAGLRPAPIARWIKKQSRGKSLTVQIGRKGGQIASFFDLVVTCGYAQLPPHPRRVEIAVPPTRITPQSLVEASREWKDLFQGSPHPRVGLLVGGSTARHRLDPEVAGRLGRDVADFAAAAGGSVFAITSRRTGPAAEAALGEGLGVSAYLHRWAPSAAGNPYLAYIGSTDVLVVTGESESMLAEAAVAGRPVYIYELPERPLSRKARMKNRVALRARRACGAAGVSVVERVLDRLCALLIGTGIVRPPRDLKTLHGTLIRAGIARRFGEPLCTESPTAIANLDAPVRRVQQLLQNRNVPVARR